MASTNEHGLTNEDDDFMANMDDIGDFLPTVDELALDTSVSNMQVSNSASSINFASLKIPKGVKDIMRHRIDEEEHDTNAKPLHSEDAAVAKLNAASSSSLVKKPSTEAMKINKPIVQVKHDEDEESELVIVKKPSAEHIPKAAVAAPLMTKKMSPAHLLHQKIQELEQQQLARPTTPSVAEDNAAAQPIQKAATIEPAKQVAPVVKSQQHEIAHHDDSHGHHDTNDFDIDFNETDSITVASPRANHVTNNNKSAAPAPTAAVSTDHHKSHEELKKLPSKPLIKQPVEGQSQQAHSAVAVDTADKVKPQAVISKPVIDVNTVVDIKPVVATTSEQAPIIKKDPSKPLLREQEAHNQAQQQPSAAANAEKVQPEAHLQVHPHTQQQQQQAQPLVSAAADTEKIKPAIVAKQVSSVKPANVVDESTASVIKKEPSKPQLDAPAAVEGNKAPLTRQKSREEMLPHKLQSKISSARLLYEEQADELDEHEHDGEGSQEELLVIPAAVKKKIDHIKELEEEEERHHQQELAQEEEELALDEPLDGGDEGINEEQDEDEYGNNFDETQQQQDEDYNNGRPSPLRTHKSKLPVADNDPSRPYQHELQKPKFQAGKTHVTLAQAKLYGLLDENGQLKLDKNTNTISAQEKKQKKQYIQNISKPRELDPELTNQHTEKLDFKPQRSEEATKAMKNPRCGYDFMDRLGTRGDFLQRVTNDANKIKGGDGNLSKAQLENMELDYNTRLDKLKCPQCGRDQSFDEFLEKRRTCGPCGIKYEKLNTTSGQAFAQKNAEREAKRLEKLKKLEAELYGTSKPSQFAPKLPTILAKQQQQQENASKRNPRSSRAAEDVMLAGPGDEAEAPSNSNENASGNNIKPQRPKSGAATCKASSRRNNAGGGGENQTMKLAPDSVAVRIDAEAAMQTMVKLHNDKAQRIMNAFGPDAVIGGSQLQQQQTAAGLPPLGKESKRGGDNVTKKMDRLVQM